MKLNPRSDPVKPDRRVLLAALASVLLTAIAVQLIVTITSREQQRMDRFGQAAARALAELAVEPLMQRDRMHLGVIGNRIAELEAVRGVATYMADDSVLTSTGELLGPQYSQAVTIDDNVIGYVRVALAPEAFTATGAARWVALAVTLLLIPFAVAGAFALLAAVREGRVTVPRFAWLRESPAALPESAVAAVEPAPAPPPDIRHYLLAVNLYNQLTLPGDEREFELSLCTELAESVAAIYQGQVVALPGVGAIVDFDHTDDPDRPFQVLCACFVIARLLRDESPFGRYRLGLNVTERPAHETLPLNDDAIADASLLSALAPDLTLAVSAPFLATLSAGDRVASRPLINPLLDELATSGPGCSLVTELHPPYSALMAQQAERLKTQREAISNPSTF